MRLLLLLAVSLLPLIAVAQEPRFEADIRRFEAADAANPPAKGGIVFIGSSSIALWRTLREDFPGHNVINRGFGGSEISDSIRVVHRIVTPYQPKMVVFFAGTNDIAAGKTAETVFDDFRTFVGEVHSKVPEARVAFISISPAPSRWDKLPEFRKANALVRNYATETDGVVYIDVFSHMLDPEGGPRPELFVEDRLHLNPSGYALWRRVVAPYLPW
jgi:lysophospholipase L1-like esterase